MFTRLYKEFLCDAVIDLVVMKYLFNKFPEATSGQLSAARSLAVCGPTLASVAVRRLGIHKHLLVNNAELSTAITTHVPLLTSLSPEDTISKGWKYDPPKALSNVLESIVGAVLVDTRFDFEKTAVIVEAVISDVLEVLTTDLPRDPVSELMVWAAAAGCRRISFQKTQSNPELRRNDSVSVVVHDVVVVGHAPTCLCRKVLQRNVHALSWLTQHLTSLLKSCAIACGTWPLPLPEVAEAIVADDTKAPLKLTDETEKGFAAIGRCRTRTLKERFANEKGAIVTVGHS
ncbi:ribonuclease III domain-containing protein [Suillus bovinus]|uniref:ribonuclease III domain-containing protein n=1 Tax=Suillus bovinus TaxID=48563 RepID=UPI001B85FCB7|nr:ribonuclease III domain-containing protein [Suillus bovinus]KAG2130167.1 ribonuclease III domain-containing protein [Suillus bovinus]